MLEVRNLTVQYGAFLALSGVSLKVEDGQIVSIVGANGAGKTTLLNTISGLIAPRSGDVFLDGDRLTGLKGHEIARRGVVQVPEGRKLFPEMTVYENLMVASIHPRAKKDREKNLKEVYALFPVLEERKDQLAMTLSGGEQQMLAIGRGMMASPRILMLDEPSLGLAPLLVRQIFDVVQELRNRGLTILLVEQNVKHSLRIADYAYVLETGKVVLEGTGKEVLENPHTIEAYMGA